MATINMQTMRYINLLDKSSGVKTTQCFVYNGTIFFAVTKDRIFKAIGPDASNIKKIQQSLGKKVRIIKECTGLNDMGRFIGDLISPNKFKSLEIKENFLTITAGNNQNKAALIGRNKRRFEELHTIIYDLFKMDLKIV